MSKLSDQDIEAIAQRIAADLRGAGAAKPSASANSSSPTSSPVLQGMGVFSTIDEAVAAARKAFPVYSGLSLATRSAILDSIRQTMRENATALARAATRKPVLDGLRIRSSRTNSSSRKRPAWNTFSGIFYRRSWIESGRTGALWRHRRDHTDHQPDLNHYLQCPRHAGRGQYRRFQRSSQRQELLGPKCRAAQ